MTIQNKNDEIGKNYNKQNCVGEKIGRLLIVSVFKNLEKGGYYANCKCDCGSEKIIYLSNIIKGSSKSCGCYNRDALSISKRTHGKSETRTYRIWRHMRMRCELKTHARYADWGGRGITVCERWAEFENFLEDMGESPPGTSIDRINNNGNYELKNCRWADSKQQNRNKSNSRWVNVLGVDRLLQEVAEEYGITTSQIRSRIKRGWSVDRAVTTPKDVKY